METGHYRGCVGCSAVGRCCQKVHPFQGRLAYEVADVEGEAETYFGAVSAVRVLAGADMAGVVSMFFLWGHSAF